MPYPQDAVQTRAASRPAGVDGPSPDRGVAEVAALPARVPHKPQEAEDAALVERLRGGDELALVEVMQKYGTAILGFAQRLLNDRQMAEEICQDTMLKLWQNAPTMHSGGHLRAWLFRVTHNTSIDRARVTGVEVEKLTDTIHATRGNPHEETERAWLSDQVRAAILKLPNAYRSYVVMRFFNNLRYEEIAVILSIPIGTAKSRHHYAMRRLAVLLKWMGLDDFIA